MASFPERIKKLRKEKGVTLQQLANEIEVTKSTLSRYENGRREPKSHIVQKLASYFNCSTDYILANTDERHTAESIKKQYEDENVDVEELFERFNVQLNGQDLDEKEWKAVIETLRNLRKAGEEGANNE